MTSPAPALPGNAACPRCGAGFRCGMVEPSGALIDCWCLQQPRALPVPRAGLAFLPKVPAPPGLSQPLTAPLPAVLLPEAPLPPSLTAALPASLPSATGPAPDQPATAACFCPACLEHLTHERQRRLSAAPD